MNNIVEKINCKLAQKYADMQLRAQLVGATRVVNISGATMLQEENTNAKFVPNSAFDTQVFHVKRGGTLAYTEPNGTTKEHFYSFNFVLVGFSKNRNVMRVSRQALEQMAGVTVTRFSENVREIAKAFLFLDGLDPKYYAFAIEYNMISSDPEIDCECLTETDCEQKD